MSTKGKLTTNPPGKLRVRRIFSDTFKRQKVADIENGLLKVSELAKLYNVSVQTVYRWLYKYSVHYEKGSVQVVQMESEQHKTRALLAQIKELEATVGRKQLRIDYLETLVSVASGELKVDLKKNFDTSSSTNIPKGIKQEDTK